MADLYVKQGATLQLLLTFQNDDNSAYDLTGAIVTSQVRDATNHLIATLTPTATGTPGVLSVSQDTYGWATGRAVLDVKISVGGAVLRSTTVGLLVDRAVTA